MNRRDLLIAKLKAKEKVRKVVEIHNLKWRKNVPQLPQQLSPPAPPQPPDQSGGYSGDNGSVQQP